MLALFAIPPKPPVRAVPAVKTVIEQRYAQLGKAVKTMDSTKVAAWLKTNATPDFFYHSIAGRAYSAKGMEGLLSDEFQGTRSIPVLQYKLTNFSFKPKETFCTATTHMVVLLAHDRKLTNDSVAVHTWVLKNGSWKIWSIVETFIKETNPIPTGHGG